MTTETDLIKRAENIVRVATEGLPGFESDHWEAPVALPAFRECGPFDASTLGDRAASFCAAVAIETATPIDLGAISALGTVSTVIAGAVVVEPHMGWQEPVNLYLNLLAAPGEGKTPALRKVVRPL